MEMLNIQFQTGTQSGTVFRLRGKGVQIVNTKNRGDQYVKVIVDIPKNLNEKQKRSLRRIYESLWRRN